jgi:solute:Na+ symporter, SSS family
VLASIVLLSYAVLLILLGVLFSRDVRTTDAFYVAGRGLGAGLLFATLLAANIGAGSTVGATGLGYRYGLSAFWWVGSAAIGSAFLAWTVGPKMWQVVRINGLYTVGDYLEFRFGRRVRTVAAVLLWFGSMSLLAGQFIAVARILEVTLGFGKIPGCLVAGIVTTSYFAAGGLHASARVNVVQLAVKMTGFVAAFLWLWHARAHSIWLTDAAAGRGAAYFSLWGDGPSSVLHYVAVLAPSFVVSPGILQKLFGARNDRVVRLGVALNAVGLLAFAAVPAMMGIIARNAFPVLPSDELALPMLLMQALPLWLGALLLAAIFSAELSAADAALFMLTTSLSRDLYQGRIRPKASGVRMVSVTRAIAVGCGSTAVIVSIALPSVISALTIFYTLLTAALFLPLIAGLYSRRTSENAALTVMALSAAVTFGLEMATAGRGVRGVPSLVIGLGAGAVALGAFALRGRRRPAA